MFLVDKKRAKTMRMALGNDASELIKDDKYLPFFRSRQKKYPKEFYMQLKRPKKPTKAFKLQQEFREAIPYFLLTSYPHKKIQYPPFPFHNHT